MVAVGWALIAGLVIWIGMWAFGVKALDSFMILLGLLVFATGWWMIRPWVMQQLRRG